MEFKVGDKVVLIEKDEEDKGFQDEIMEGDEFVITQILMTQDENTLFLNYIDRFPEEDEFYVVYDWQVEKIG